MPILLKIVARATCLLGAILALTQDIKAATNESAWMKREWLSDDGLPNNTVNSIGQTPDGYLWLATANGLARFDGSRFEEISTTNFVRPPDRGLLTMTVTRTGGLRLATDRASVICLDAGKQQVFTTEQGLPDSNVNALIEDAEHGLWITYRGGSVYRLKDGKVTRFTEKDGLPAGSLICSLACDDEGRIWFVKAGHLGVFREGRFQTLANLEAAPSRLTVARGGGVWVCCGYRLSRFDEGKQLEDVGAFVPKRGGTEVTGLIESRDGAVWIGTSVSGLLRYADSQFDSVPTTHQEILNVTEDAEGNIWVGTGGGGLNQMRPRALHLQAVDVGLPFESVQSLAQDAHGVIWAATQDGSLSRFVDGRWMALPTGTNWSGDAMCLSADPNGDLWIGTRSHRLLCWREGRFVDWGDPLQIKAQTIHTLVVSRTGDLWIGGDSPASVMRLRDGKIKNFDLPPDIRVIRASAEDAAGNIWFGTSKGILLRVVGDQLVDETARTTGLPQPIRCLYATPDGGLWIGYAGAGVGLLKGDQFSIIDAKRGLYDDFVSQIVADDRGWLWFGANRGVFKVRQREMEAAVARQGLRVRSVHYGQGDGLPSLQATFGNSPIALRSRDGRIWLAMRTALAVADPEKLREQSPSPPVLLSRMAVGDRTVAAYGGVLPVPAEGGGKLLDLATSQSGLRVPPDHRRVEFEFTALSFVGPENVSLRYRLEGADEDWTEAGAQRNAVYLRLPAGKYRFQASACNSEGVWNDTGATVSFVVMPFMWQTWWFRSLVLVTFTGLVISVVRYVSFRRLRLRLRQLEQQATLYKERARIAKDIHDDLGANLTQISLIGELARQDRDVAEKVGEHIEKMSGTARRAVKSLDEIVWAVNPRNDTLAHFIDYTGQFVLDYLRVAGIRCRLELPEQTPERELSTDVRHNLFLVVKEAINNTVKHAQATELRLRISVSPEKLEISVEDNGRGFDGTHIEDGSDGLRNMRQRLADIGGQCWIQGRPGAGTKVSIELPAGGNLNLNGVEHLFDSRSKTYAPK